MGWHIGVPMEAQGWHSSKDVVLYTTSNLLKAFAIFCVWSRFHIFKKKLVPLLIKRALFLNIGTANFSGPNNNNKYFAPITYTDPNG
jgi:hypothetical protein